jgi:hypothetical protein
MQLFDDKFIISGNDTEELRVVNHTTTLPNAIRVLQEGITSNIPDARESRVSALKASVVWTSPNEWKNEESPFGCVSFDIEWRHISQEFNRIYKVQDEDLIRKYANPTYRLLFTNNAYDNERLVKPFNPKKDKGPLKYINNTWHKKRNTSIVGHFLLELIVVGIEKISRIKFVKHDQCGAMNRYVCGSAFLAYILSTNHQDLNRLFKVDNAYDGNLVSYINYIKTHKFDDLPPKSRRAPQDPQFLIRRFLRYYYLSISEPWRADEYDRRSCKILASIGGKNNATDALYSYVTRHFDFDFR